MTMMSKKGKFITFEGPEGSGKTTQVKACAKRLEAEGIQFITTREPGGTPTGEAIRNILQHDATGEPICNETEALLFAASRAQHVQHVIAPALNRGDWILCDRYIDSSAAYQGRGRNLTLEKVIEINQFAINNIWPDITFLLDIPSNVAAERLATRNLKKDRIEAEDLPFHERVRKGFLELARKFPDRIKIIPADQPSENISTTIWEMIHSIFLKL